MNLLKVGYVVGAAAAAGAIARNVRKGHTADFDRTVTLAIQQRKGRAFGRLMWHASWAGFPPQSRTIPLVLPALFLIAGQKREAKYQLAGWGTSLISGSIKTFMQRPRPYGDEFTIHEANIGGTSFPSGHVINYVGVYGTLATILNERMSHGPAKTIVLGAIATQLALVGPSRIYLGHHWFTDVTTSYLLGTGYVTALGSLYRRGRM
jgi:membrane-associated phospholipid phosphatase